MTLKFFGELASDKFRQIMSPSETTASFEMVQFNGRECIVSAEGVLGIVKGGLYKKLYIINILLFVNSNLKASLPKNMFFDQKFPIIHYI